VPLVEQELPTLPDHLTSPLVFSGVLLTWSLVLCVMFCRSLFVLFLLAIVLSVLLWFTDSDYLPLVSFGHCIVCSSLIYRFWLPPPLVSFGHCVVCLSLIYRFWLPLWYLRYTDSDYLLLVSSNSSNCTSKLQQWTARLIRWLIRFDIYYN
jgi:hypothetical protein